MKEELQIHTHTEGNVPGIIDLNKPLLETENNISKKRIRRELRSRQRLQQAFRVLGRIYNPLIDTETGILVIGSIFLLLELNNPNNILEQIAYSLPFGFFLVSMGYEIHASRKLSRHSHFALSEPDFKHIIILEENLKAIYPNVAMYDLQTLLAIADKNTARPRLINDFKHVLNYNVFRKIMETFQMSMFGATTILALSSWSMPITLLLLFPLLILFVFKNLVNKIESRWDIYQPKWQQLSLSSRKILTALNIIADFLYDAMFVFGAFNIFVFSIMPAYNMLQGNFSNLGLQITYVVSPTSSPVTFSFTDAVWFLLGSALIYATIQQIPSYKASLDTVHIHRLKRCNQSLFQSTRAAGSIFLSLITFYGIGAIFAHQGSDIYALSVVAAISVLLSFVGGVTAFANTFINYQERDLRKLTVLDDEIRALREEVRSEGGIILPRNYNSLNIISQESPTEENLIAIKTEQKESQQFCCSRIWSSFWRGEKPNPKLVKIKLAKEQTSSDEVNTSGRRLNR